MKCAAHRFLTAPLLAGFCLRRCPRSGVGKPVADIGFQFPAGSNRINEGQRGHSSDLSFQVASGLTSALGTEQTGVGEVCGVLSHVHKTLSRGSDFSKTFGIFLATHNEEDGKQKGVQKLLPNILFMSATCKITTPCSAGMTD